MRKVDPEGWPTLGWDIIEWIESRLVHGPGDVQGDPITLDPELARFVLRCYRIHPDTGRRMFDEALLLRVKGRAKSELAGMLACAEARGPVRFDHWDPDTGEPVGAPVRYPFIRCMATEEEQVGNVYLNAAYMLWVARDEWPDCAGIDLGRDWQTSTRVVLPGGGEVRPSTASSAAKDGGLETFVVFDETHLYVLAELARMYQVVKRNLDKRRQAEPWALQTSTMYAKGMGSIAEQTDAAGRGARADPHLLVDRRGARKAGLPLDDDELMLAELRHVYGAFAGVIDLERILRALRSPREGTEEDRRRYFLGEATEVSAKFLPAGAFDGRAAPQVEVADGTPVALGFDGSLRQDAAAIRLVTREGHHFYPLKADGTGPAVWERPPDLPAAQSWEVPVGEVEATIDYVHLRYRVVRGYYDPAWWGGHISVWRGRFGADIVVPWWTHRDAAMARACRSIRNAITTTEQGADLFTHDGHPVAARHWANAYRRMVRVRDEQGRPMFTMAKEEPGSPNKIDTAIADTLAREARADALAAGAFELEPAAPPPDIY